MSVVMRCEYCHRFFGVPLGAVSSKNAACPKCGKTIKNRAYYVDFRAMDGKHVRQSAGFDLTTARAMDLKLKNDKKLERLPAEYRRVKQTTFRSFMKDVFMPHYIDKNKGLPKYIFDYFISAFGDKAMNNITPAEIEKALIFRFGKLADATYNQAYAVIHRVFQYAIELEIVQRSSVVGKKKKLDNKRLRFLSVEEQSRLLGACRQSKSPYLYEMVYIALYTGLRAGEIKSLTPNNIANGELVVEGINAKSGKTRYIPLTSELEQFFKSASFNYWHDYRDGFAAALKRAEIKDCRFHDLRHTFASRLAQNGVSLQVIAELLGHSSLEMSKRYAHLVSDTRRKAMETLEMANRPQFRVI